MDLVHKHPTQKKSSILGKFQQPRKGLRSTQEKFMHPDPDPKHDQFSLASKSENTNVVFSGKFYTYQTGRFLVTSSKGNKYILVAYHYN